MYGASSEHQILLPRCKNKALAFTCLARYLSLRVPSQQLPFLYRIPHPNNNNNNNNDNNDNNNVVVVRRRHFPSSLPKQLGTGQLRIWTLISLVPPMRAH
eukprot:998590-Amphidinium_carterae.1